MRSTISIKWIVLIGLPIIMWQCYWYVGFNQETTKLLNFVVSFIMLAIAGMDVIKNRAKNKGYEGFVKWIVILFLISLFSSYLYWGQSPLLTFRAGVSVLSILYFYVLRKLRVTEQDLFKLVSVFASIYILLWLFALSQAPRVVFGNLEEVNNDRGFYRILQLKSIDTVCLLYFISLVRGVIQNKGIKWILLAVGCFVVIFLSMSRMLIFSILVVSAFFIFRKRFFLAFLVASILFLGYDKLYHSEIVAEMLNMTESQISGQEEGDLRMVEYKNAFTAYPFHIGTLFFGNGSPHILSTYGKYDENLKNTIDFNLTDSGYVGVFVEYGILMLVVLLLILLKVAKAKPTMIFQPYRLYIIALYILCITSYAFWGHGISFAISLYALTIEEEVPVLSVSDNKQRYGIKRRNS